MFEPITERVVQILYHSEHILMPLVELYKMLAGEGWMAWINPEMFEYLLSEDGRFEIFEGLADPEFMDPGVPMALNIHGLLVGPLVMLRRRAISTEVVQLDLLSHLEEMNAALEIAWQLRPEDDEAIESDLLNLLMMGDMLARELKYSLRLGLFSPHQKEGDAAKTSDSG